MIEVALLETFQHTFTSKLKNRNFSVPKRTNVQNKLVRDILPDNLGPQRDESRDTAYCSYSSFSFNDFDLAEISSSETVDQFISRKLQFPECHDFAYEIFDDIYMVSTYLSSFLEKDPRLSVTTAAGNRFEVRHLNRISTCFLLNERDFNFKFFYNFI